MLPDGLNSPLAAPTEEDLGRLLRDYVEVAGRLQRTHAALQDEVTRLRQELASKDRELELRRRLAALGELAAGMAHEVRNPLGAIQLYNDLLRAQCRTHEIGPALQLVEKIEAGIQAIDAVVQDALALAPRDRQLAACPVATVVARAADTTARVVSARGVRLEISLSDPELHARADEAGLQRVLVNLIVNAAEASSAGKTVWLDGRTAADEVVELRVADEGSGLPEELAERIFEPFFTTKAQGTGLGLTIAHRLIEAYGGRLTAGNRPEGGAEFVIRLPQAAAGATHGRDAARQPISAA